MNYYRLIFCTLLIIAPALIYAQQETLTKRIEVTGEAEMEITPNEIDVRITLKEYLDGRKKVEMDKLESGLVKALRAEDISKDKLTIESIYGYNWNWKKQRAEEFLATKSFKLKVVNLKKMNDLLERLDQKGINNVSVASYTHSDIIKFKNELKLQALKNAKEKARYLLNGIDEQLGSVIVVTEVDHHQPIAYRAQMMEVADSELGYQSDLEFQTIKLKATIRAVFGIE